MGDRYNAMHAIAARLALYRCQGNWCCRLCRKVIDIHYPKNGHDDACPLERVQRNDLAPHLLYARTEKAPRALSPRTKIGKELKE